VTGCGKLPDFLKGRRTAIDAGCLKATVLGLSSGKVTGRVTDLRMGTAKDVQMGRERGKRTHWRKAAVACFARGTAPGWLTGFVNAQVTDGRTEKVTAFRTERVTDDRREKVTGFLTGRMMGFSNEKVTDARTAMRTVAVGSLTGKERGSLRDLS
jgi:hypothetical protein